MLPTTKPFHGANVFMSRNLVPPELFDTLHDALKENGAQVFLCCNPTHCGPNDYHVISSSKHEKFDDLRSKGCQLLGPQCVLSCAKERRTLPKQGFTCCLAMYGVTVLATGFDMDEKVKITELVTAMGGVLLTKSSADVNFVIAKHVLAAKYKWALNVLKKPIVSISWLHQCWNEHRVVPQVSYVLLPFSGLMICVTKVPPDERRKMQSLIVENGGKYSADLTKECTHLISDAPEGDKYKVAVRWGHIHVVNRKWIDQSIARRACLDEHSYPVHCGSVRAFSASHHSQDRAVRHSLSAHSSAPVDSTVQVFSSSGIGDQDLEATLSQELPSVVSDTTTSVKEEDKTILSMEHDDVTNFDGCVADDSQTEDNDLYLSECRILLVGFDASEMRKLVKIVRKGGGSRYMSFDERLTHLVLGNPSETEKKELRGLTASGMIKVVKTIWLEDCSRVRKEIPVLQRHSGHDLILQKGVMMGNAAVRQGKNHIMRVAPANLLQGATSGMSIENCRGPQTNMKTDSCQEASARPTTQSQISACDDSSKGLLKLHSYSGTPNHPGKKALDMFKGKTFCFSRLFPEDRRAEIVKWVTEGGGEMVGDDVQDKVHFTVQCHGVMCRDLDSSLTAYVSSHWIRSCLDDGRLLDVSSHILYSPLSCQVPLPGFESFRLCVSQYEEKDKLLLRNLCFVLGAKLVEKLSKRVSHLLCKFMHGPKFEAACKWGVQPVTCDWIYECIRQNKVVDVGPFYPKEASTLEKEAGLCTVSQYPSQALQTISGENPSQLVTQFGDQRNKSSLTAGSPSDLEETARSIVQNKRARLDVQSVSVKSHVSHNIRDKFTTDILENTGNSTHFGPDVATAIEDLLEQTSKIHDVKTPERTGGDKAFCSSNGSILGPDHADVHSAFGLSKHWLSRSEKRDDLCNPSGDGNASTYDNFSETQTESQVVGYEEDLSGRQMIIDRVRTRSITS